MLEDLMWKRGRGMDWNTGVGISQSEPDLPLAVSPRLDHAHKKSLHSSYMYDQSTR